MDIPIRETRPIQNPARVHLINSYGHTSESSNTISPHDVTEENVPPTATSANSIQLTVNKLNNRPSHPKLQPRQTSLSELRTLEESQKTRDFTGPVYPRHENRPELKFLLTRPFQNSYDGRGEGKVFKMGGGESYRPGGDPPRSPIGRADTFRSSDRDRDRSPRRERARTPIRDRDRDRARTPIRDRARTPVRDRARTPIRERARTPPPTDRYLPPSRDRSPRRRSRSPGTFRRRERSPMRDSRDGSTWRARDRARSPPPRRISPRRDSPRRDSPRRGSPRRGSPRRGSPRRGSPRRESPRRDEYRRAPSPRRDLIRDRDTRGRSRSPFDRDRGVVRARSPLPSRRSPPPPVAQRGAWRRPSRTPERRNDRVFTGPTSLTWRRPRSPSPPPPRDSQQTSGRNSGNTSRRSSPPVHPSRVALQPSRASTPINRERSLSARPTNYRDEDVDMLTPQDQSPVRAPVSRESPMRRSPPRGPSGYKAPPSGPSGAHRNFTAPPISVSAHNRPENNGVLAAPAGPRGYQPPYRGRGRGAFRGENTWHNPALIRPTASVSPTLAVATPTAPSSIPTGPRAGTSHTILTDRSKTWVAVPPRAPANPIPSSSFSRPAISRSFENTSSTITSAPGGGNNSIQSKPHIRNHPSLSTLPTIVAGGRKDPNASGMPRDLEARLRKNEEEAERLREDLRVKEEKVRFGLRGWERLERESRGARLRSELSEQQVRVLAGEGIGGAF